MFFRLLIYFQETISQKCFLNKRIPNINGNLIKIKPKNHTQLFNEIIDCVIAADNVINIKNKYFNQNIECDVAREHFNHTYYIFNNSP